MDNKGNLHAYEKLFLIDLQRFKGNRFTRRQLMHQRGMTTSLVTKLEKLGILSKHLDPNNNLPYYSVSEELVAGF